ncbi:MAG: hypothetical protein AB1578_22650 [Thermodesulfobacteriota bacterium]
MKLRLVLLLSSAALFAAVAAIPASAAGQNRQGAGPAMTRAGAQNQVRTQTQQRLRDGSGSQVRGAAQGGTSAGDRLRQRLQDGSCLTAPTE